MSENNIIGSRDFAIAKEILKRKFVVGLFDHMEESIERFETFFGWNVGVDAHTCQESEIGHIKAKHYNNVNLPPVDTPSFAALVEKNRIDLELYDYARFLYNYQGQVLFGINDGSAVV